MPCKIKEQFDGLLIAGYDKTVTLEQINKWLAEAGLMGQTFTETEVKSYFDKMKTNALNHDQFMTFLEELAQSKGMLISELENQLAACKLADIVKVAAGGQASRR